MSHKLATSLFFVGDDNSQMTHAFLVRHRAALRTGLHSFQVAAGAEIGKRFFNEDFAEVQLFAGFHFQVEAFTGSKTFVNVIEIKNPETDAQLVAQNIAMQLEKRAHYGAAIKKAIEKALSGKALGIKIMVSGRLGGAEIARTEWKREGRVPLHTLCADIDYGFTEANTISGKIGIKVWIFKRTHFAKSPKEIMNELKKHRDMENGSTEGATEVAAPAVETK